MKRERAWGSGSERSTSARANTSGRSKDWPLALGCSGSLDSTSRLSVWQTPLQQGLDGEPHTLA